MNYDTQCFNCYRILVERGSIIESYLNEDGCRKTQ